MADLCCVERQNGVVGIAGFCAKPRKGLLVRFDSYKGSALSAIPQGSPTLGGSVNEQLALAGRTKPTKHVTDLMVIGRRHVL